MSSADYRTRLTLVTASALAWSTKGYFTRLIPLDTWTVLAWRGVIGAMGIAVVIIILQRGRGVSDFLHFGRAGSLFALVSGRATICLIFALRHTTVAHCPSSEHLALMAAQSSGVSASFLDLC